ncbi:1824_t:CDS:2, partial [Cetraspora pellucida]
MKEIGKENSNYPMDHTIKAPNCYLIPDNYVIETTYRKKEKTITCYIDYYNEKPQYTIKFGLNKDEF